MKTEVIENTTYYRIESPRGVMSDVMTENDVKCCQKRGYFTILLWSADGKEAYATRRYKIGKIHKFVRKTTITEQIFGAELAIY